MNSRSVIVSHALGGVLGVRREYIDIDVKPYVDEAKKPPPFPKPKSKWKKKRRGAK